MLMLRSWKGMLLTLGCGILFGIQLNENLRLADEHFKRLQKYDEARFSAGFHEVDEWADKVDKNLSGKDKVSVRGVDYAPPEDRLTSTSTQQRQPSHQATIPTTKRKYNSPSPTLSLRRKFETSQLTYQPDRSIYQDGVAKTAKGQTKAVLPKHEEIPTSNPQRTTSRQVVEAPKSLPKSEYEYAKTGKVMSGCLLLLDDTIRLLEWLAYHYTVLPLGHLVVALDPKSKRVDKVFEILDSWSDFMNITVYTNDTWLTLGPLEGWGRNVHAPTGRYRGWFKNKKGDSYRSQAHKRRQNFFFSFCLNELYEVDGSWTVLIDSDEFLIFNYHHPEGENPNLYDSVNIINTKEDVDNDRKENLPIRDRLPSFDKEVTVADFLADYEEKAVKELGEIGRPRCLNFPHLQFSSHESNASEISRGLPMEADPMTLLTLRQRKTGPMVGEFSKAMLNLRTAPSREWLKFESVVNVHTPNRRMCGRKGNTGSGTDYVASLFRLHHYRSGSIETYLERSGDYRGGSIWRFYNDRNFEPVGENDDIRPWVNWFVRKVGMANASRLLFQPITEAYQEIDDLSHIDAAKESLSKLHPNLLGKNYTSKEVAESGHYKKTNRTISVCLLLKNDSIRLMEWMAYHYTVLPIGKLIVGINSGSVYLDRTMMVLKKWREHLDIRVYSNESWMEGIKITDGWNVNIYNNNTGKLQPWFHNQNSTEFIARAQSRRRKVFTAECLADLKDAGSDWATMLDSDEFVIFNYEDAGERAPPSKGRINQEQNMTAAIRSRLPRLEQHITIADFLDHETLGTCLRLPALNFSAHQMLLKRGDLPAIAQEIPTLTQQRVGSKTGTSNRILFNLAVVDRIHITWKRMGTPRNPNRKLCNLSKAASTAGYRTVLRINHYVAGTVESYFEGLGNSAIKVDKFLEMRNFDPVGQNDDIVPWLDWFVAKVGAVAASKLLFQPLAHTYQLIQHVITLKDVKATLWEKGILPLGD